MMIRALFSQLKVISTGELQGTLHTCLVTVQRLSTCQCLYGEEALCTVSLACGKKKKEKKISLKQDFLG